MITPILIIALTVNGIMINPVYLYIISRLSLQRKPFNCVYCLSWWLGWFYIAIQAVLGTFNPLQLIIPLAASYLATCFDKWFSNQPITFK